MWNRANFCLHLNGRVILNNQLAVCFAVIRVSRYKEMYLFSVKCHPQLKRNFWPLGLREGLAIELDGRLEGMLLKM